MSDIFKVMKVKVCEATLPILHVEYGMPLADAIVAIGFAKSKREARQLIKDGAVRLGPVPEGLRIPKK